MNRPLRVAAASLAVAGALGSVAASAQAKTLNLVIAGDSYSSGVGTGSYYNTSCYRSSIVWGEDYAKDVRAKGITVNVKNVACGGAVVKDLDGQINSITPDTDLVALTIGGNDVGFANIVIQCFAPAISDPARCGTAISNAKKGLPNVEVAALKRIDALKAKLRPGAKLLLLSYPYLAQPSNYILRGLFNSYAAGPAVRSLGDAGDAIDIDAINQANAKFGAGFASFVPTKDLFAGHEPNPDPYKDNPSSWINEFSNLKNPIDIYHPRPAGQLAMAAAIERMPNAGPDLDFGVSR